MTWLVRWIVRDWTSCFLTCRLPLDDHERDSSPRVAVRNMAFDKRNEKSFNSIHKNSKKCNNKRHLNVKDKDGVPIGNRFDDSSWSLSVDEDYIVFCFGEEGAFDVVKDDEGVKSEAPINPLNLKLKYGEDAEQVSDLSIHNKRSNTNQYDTDQQDQDCIILSKEGEEKEMVYTGRQQSTRRVRKVEGIEDCGMVYAESRDSDQSEGSTGSFAFPVLGWEWIGSPVQMPKSEGQHLKKHKVRSLRFQCCRF